jgi:tRNA threonylcarbamoyl adenosine modification protein YeaZ
MTFIAASVLVASANHWRLVIDTATRRTVLAVGRGRELVAVDVRDGPDRHGSYLMAQLTSVLQEAGIGMDDVEAIGVASGPGSFTGLRVGLATAKTLAARRHLTLVGLPTDAVLRRAAASSLGPDKASEAVVLLPAGARDHYLASPGADVMLVPPDTDMLPLIGSRPVVAVDMDAAAAWFGPIDAAVRAGGLPGPMELGRSAVDGSPAAALGLLDELIASGDVADPATLVPRYVALPRGIARSTAAAADALDAHTGGEGTWSPVSR